ncbi:hypothetical protein E1161_03360 [Saccharopolyspora aridisoli]|uniref:Uncharacterized protein n=1 Tax=Saccharopolyspora aridisoli TaxID=2530385 RepID=A0A4V2Y8H2_9PSEU|nr:gephyrin-like molybdotransferase receptor GlpR [Saccharopolyspora aridisoli]TDC95835.1 hypothetical protein E1161_03360 [Saccharopolyspora aridisoli]
MPSSLIFAALAAAWLVVLVPMFARRRQEVSKTTDSALAARVVRRGSDRRPARSEAATTDRVEVGMPEPGLDVDEQDETFEEHDEDWRPVNSEDVRAGRRYRPGRGGYDPEAAALVARAKYARRQRIVLTMLLLAVTTGLLAALLWPVLWWGHAVVDLSLVGYLTYLRRQVRIEEGIRARRLARINGERDDVEPEEDEVDYDERDDSRRDDLDDDYDYTGDPEFDELGEFIEDYEDEVAEGRRPDPVPAQDRAADIRPVVPGVRVEIDDEDPVFDELDERAWEPYRRAAGE